MAAGTSRSNRGKQRQATYLDVAVVGLGAIGAAHVEAVTKATSTRLAAVVDVDAPRAREFAIRHGCEAFHSIAAMLEGADVDLVIIATPDALHVDAVKEVAAAG